MGRIVDENYEPIYCDALEDEHEYVGKKLDLVEVVRCKDCKFYEDEEVGMVYCPNIVGGWVQENFYCGNGGRKERK